MSRSHQLESKLLLKSLNLAEINLLAGKLASSLKLRASQGKGTTIFLEGELGAGKTTLAQGIISRLCSAAHVPSPTYSIINTYQIIGAKDDTLLYHIDCFRLANAGHLVALGVDDLYSNQHLLLVEWPQKAIEALPAADLTVEISLKTIAHYQQEIPRQIVIRGSAKDVIADLRAKTNLSDSLALGSRLGSS